MLLPINQISHSSHRGIFWIKSSEKLFQSLQTNCLKPRSHEIARSLNHAIGHESRRCKTWHDYQGPVFGIYLRSIVNVIWKNNSMIGCDTVRMVM